MMGLLKKDILSYRMIMMQIVLMVVLMSVLSIQMKETSFLLGAFSALPLLWMLTSFLYDDSCNWGEFALAQALTKKEIVLSKYVFGLLNCFLAGIIGLVLSIIMGLFIDMGDSMKDLLEVAFATFVIGNVMNAILLPIVFRFGAQKSRIYLLLFVILGISVGYAISDLINFDLDANLMTFLNDNMLVLLLGLFVCVEALSIAISLFVYRRKESK